MAERGASSASSAGQDLTARILPEDCVEYAIYIVDKALDSDAVRTILRAVQSAATKLVNQYLKGFLWQREDFKLQLVREHDRNLLRGRTNFGDSINDEWLIVWLLRELSLQFPSAYVSVIDTDGQFLLIEAANALPLWLNPEIADFRVWINAGKLSIIPVDNPGGKNRRYLSSSDTLTLDNALEFLKNSTSKLLHSTKIQNEAFHRLQKYPEQIEESLHHALVKIPRKLAFILYEDENSIARAVEAFYLRDPISLRPLQSGAEKNLFFPPIDCVSTSLKFTKVGYAQLVSQKFQAPPAWKHAVSARGDARAKQHAELGMKVACGFEMLLGDDKNQDNKIVQEIKLILNDLETGDASLPTDDDVRKRGMREDDQKWMDVDFNEFQRELDGKTDASVPGTGFGDRGTEEHLRKIVSRFGELLQDDEAGAENAEFLDAMDEDDDDEEDETSEDGEAGETDSDDEGDLEGLRDLDFNEDDFTKMMQEMMGMPPEVMREVMNRPLDQTQQQASRTMKTVDRKSGPASDDASRKEVLQYMAQMEKELHDAGALDL